MSVKRAIAARNKRIADRALKPWSEFERGTGDPDFYEKTGNQWLSNQAAMMEDIEDRLSRFDYVNPSAPVMQRMAGDIASEYGVEFDEAIRNLIRTGHYRGDGPVVSNAVLYGVPAAAADERMGLAALNLSGYEDPRLLNTSAVHATDLQADLNGKTYNIDSQKIVNSNDTLSLGALQNVESSVPIFRMLERSNAKTVLDALHQLQEASRRQSGGAMRTRDGFDVSAAENKLMQSANSQFNPNPSQMFADNEEFMRKDGLLMSDHSDYIAPRQEFAAGSYDPRKPQSFSVVDLEALRGVLGSISLDDLERMGGGVATHRVGQNRRHFEQDARSRGGRLSDVSIQLPKSILAGASGGMQAITPEALQYLAQTVA